MGLTLNLLFLLAALLFFAVLFMNTLRTPPAPEVLARWRLGPFWVSRGLWAASGALMGLSALSGVAVVIAHGVGADWSAAAPWLTALGALLCALAAGALLFSVVLYRGPPRPRPHRF